jgi:regulator of protease activity HflC (stomatin/prohibitin superfamily)
MMTHLEAPRMPAVSKSRILAGLLLTGLLAVLAVSSVVVIPAGHVGIYDLFGQVADQSLSPGIQLANPLAKIRKVSVRTQEAKETVDVPSREGLAVNIDVSLLFRLEPERAAQVFRSIGPHYVQVVVIPQLRSVVRDVTSAYDAKALYTTEREQLARNIQKNLFPMLRERGVICEQVLLRKITLPPKLTAAIESKLEAEQQAEQMRYVLDKERQEADRKRIEAQGIADYQTIINAGLNENLLRWKGIEATRELARSPNAKMVVIGAGKEGLPVILGNP